MLRYLLFVPLAVILNSDTFCYKFLHLSGLEEQFNAPFLIFMVVVKIGLRSNFIARLKHE